jgi:peptidoglycan hydrolase-like protein with peptidoglycan-binding domain
LPQLAEKEQAPEKKPEPEQEQGASGGAGQVNHDVKLDNSSNGQNEGHLRPFFDAMQKIATEIAPKFAPYGMKMKPEILLSVAMQESGGSKDPANVRSFDDGLGLMQITPYKGQLDDNLAKILNWDNSKPVEYNVQHSKWRDAESNIRAGATELLNKAAAIKSLLKSRGAAGVWDEMDEPHKWRAVAFAYNAGQGSAVNALVHGGPNAPMISTFTYKGKTISHDYTAEFKSREDYVDAHDPFSGGGGGGGGAPQGGGQQQGPQQGGGQTKPPETHKDEPAPSNNGPAPIKGSVGQGGKNDKADVIAVQNRLNERGVDAGTADGIVGPHTIHAIKTFQASFMKDPDGLIEPGHETQKHLFFDKGKVPAPAVVKPKEPTGGAQAPQKQVEQPAPGKTPNTQVVPNAGELPRINPGVKLTPAIENAYRVLVPYLPASVHMTSGLRSDADQARIINEYYVQRGGPADVKDVEQRRQWLKNKGMIIAAVGTSPHRTGLAFDLSGAALSSIDAAVHSCFKEHPQDFHFKDTIVERANNCLHVDLTG